MAGSPAPDCPAGLPPPPPDVWMQLNYSGVARNRNALPTTLTDDSAMAAAAMIGDSRMPTGG
jgi:hypothetical protein